MRFYIIAGEASGDLIGGLLIKALKRQKPDSEIFAWGGEKMEAAGAVIRKHYRDLAFMGFAEVVKHLPEIMRNFSFCKSDLIAFNPDAIIFIDYPGFNMRMAHWAKKQSAEKKWKTIYYVAPQAWAWKERRVYALKRDVDLMLCILPFEKDFFARFNLDVEFVGHPLLDVVDDFKKTKGKRQNTNSFREMEKPYIALLPGSRKQEIEKNLNIMLGAIFFMPDFNFRIAAAANQPLSLYTEIIEKYKENNIRTSNFDDIKVIQGDTYNVLLGAEMAAVKSGTSTLEAALFNVPQVVCYRAGRISYQIAKRIVKVPFIGLVNLISEKLIAVELIQSNFNPVFLAKHLAEAYHHRLQMQTDYKELRRKLGSNGASERAAKSIIQFVELKEATQTHSNSNRPETQI